MIDERGPTLAEPVRGSWDDLYQQAYLLRERRDPELIPVYTKLITRLGNLKPALLEAGEGYLAGMRFTAISDVLAHFLLLEEYEKALAWIDGWLPSMSTEELITFRGLRADVLHLMERDEEASAELDAWVHVASDIAAADAQRIETLVRFGLVSKAEERIATFTERVQQMEDGAERDLNLALSHMLRVSVGIARGEYDAAVSHFMEACNIESIFTTAIRRLYSSMIQNGVSGPALQLLDAEDSKDPQAHFWRGVALHQEGRDDEARRAWAKGLRKQFADLGVGQAAYWILCQLALGDPKGQGLAASLQAIRKGNDSSWLMLALAGIGSAQRGEMDAAHANLGTAADHYRSLLVQGRRLPPDTWFYCRLLLPEKTAHALRGHFQTDHPPIR